MFGLKLKAATCCC